MMGERRVMQEALFYGFSLERHVPDNHMLRRIDRLVDLSDLRAHLGPYYSDVGRPSIDPELMMRMLIVGYCFGIRSERRLCEEVHLNLAYRWFCRLGLDGDVPDHSTFSKNRHGRFRESDLLRKLFETVVARCMKEGMVGGEAFAVDASIIVADAHRRRGGECQESCVRGRFSHHALTNLSSNMMANWVLASHHSRVGIFHVCAIWRKTRYSNLIAASSVGKCPLVRTARRSLAFKDSMAFVV